MRRETLVIALLLIVGTMQMTGAMLGLPWLKGLGFATAASPHPKVFSAVQGLETYSSTFFLEWQTDSGKQQSMQLTPELNRNIRGPYNRRNVYGAVLAYGPVLHANPATRPTWESVARAALCNERPLLTELGIDTSGVRDPLFVRLEPGTAEAPEGLTMRLEVPCAQ